MKTFFLSLLGAFAMSPLFSAEFLDTTGQPTIGNQQASVQVVAFLEPKCPDSKKYSDSSFPKLKTEYIDSNKIRYSVIMTSFLSHSMPAALALLCVYNQKPAPRTDLFFKYLDYIYQHQLPERQNWTTTETLVKYAASTSPEINTKELKNCINIGRFQSQVEKDTAYGNQLMGRLSTPTIYVNGIKVKNSDDTIDYANLRTAIEEALQG